MLTHTQTHTYTHTQANTQTHCPTHTVTHTNAHIHGYTRHFLPEIVNLIAHTQRVYELNKIRGLRYTFETFKLTNAGPEQCHLLTTKNHDKLSSITRNYCTLEGNHYESNSFGSNEKCMLSLQGHTKTGRLFSIGTTCTHKTFD